MIDIVFSYDLSGSMFPALTQTRREVSKTVEFLFNHIPDLQIGIVGFSDYCDGASGLYNQLDLTNDKNKIVKFVNEVKNQGGGDAPEAYEYMLNKMRSISWRSGKNRSLVMIGDQVPHAIGDRTGGTTVKLDWKNEAKMLSEMNVKIYPVQALGCRSSDWFYDELAEIGNGVSLELNQFAHVNDLLMAICFNQQGRIEEFQSLLKPELRESYYMKDIVNTLKTGKSVRYHTKKKRATLLRLFIRVAFRFLK